MKYNFSFQGPYEDYCAGYENPGENGGGYVVPLTLGVGVVKKKLSHYGSSVLDQTAAFDLAEVSDVNIGQINMITVSSFCGPHGNIWGYHLAKQPKTAHHLLKSSDFEHSKSKIQVFSATPLIEASRSLIGTVKKPKFQIFPGSHIPCANKSIMADGPKILYCAVGIGITRNRKNSANLMMEDVGYFDYTLSDSDIQKEKRQALINLVKSIQIVGKNQNVNYAEAFVEIKTIRVEADETGCALVAAPYLTLAKKAIPESGESSLSSMTLQEWENSIQ